MKDKYDFKDFLEIMKTLRSENGCPWDKVQTHESLKKYMLEESYEVVEAIDKNDMANLCEELGDVLLQVVFHAQIASEEEKFTMDDVIDGISKKMITRHPHIFSDQVANTPEEVLDNWEKIKKKEKNQKTQTEVLKSVPKAMPAMMRAVKVQSKAADVGFDFTEKEEALNKLSEEVEEFKEALGSADCDKKDKVESEFGDILFSLMNISRFFKLNPEFSLTKSTEKFINRFEYIENSMLKNGQDFSQMSMKQLDELWDEAKTKGY